MLPIVDGSVGSDPGSVSNRRCGVPWIRTIGKADATGDLAEVYRRVAPGDTPLDNILGVHALHPRTLEDHYALYRTLMYGRGPLSRR